MRVSGETLVRTISWRVAVTMSFGVVAVAACSTDDDAGGDETSVASSIVSAAVSVTEKPSVTSSTFAPATTASTPSSSPEPDELFAPAAISGAWMNAPGRGVPGFRCAGRSG